MGSKIYKIVPTFIKTILLNIIAFMNHRKRYSSQYYKYLEEYLLLWESDEDYFLLYQREKLIALLKECYCYVHFYRDIFIEKKITVQDIEKNPYKVLHSLPILQKRIRKEKVYDLINKNKDRSIVEIGYTSGTSGSPTKNYLDRESIERAFALWDRFKKTIGVDRKSKSVRFSGRIVIDPERCRPPFWIHNYVDNQVFMSSYHLKEAFIPYYINMLNKTKPAFIDGYPSAIYILAKFINSGCYELNFKPIVIATTAETLYEYQRIEIETAFKCKVCNQYASSEGSPFITECSMGKLHINEDSGIFEFLDIEDNPAKAGTIAKMVVTSFRNWKTPLLRYDIGDSVLLPEVQSLCTCGCKMPYVEKIIGREDDILWTEEKGYVGRMDTAYKGLVGIVKSQMIQKEPSVLIVNNVIDNEYSHKIEYKLISNIKERLGDNIEIIVNIVEDIPLGANGKFNAVKREFEVKF